MKKLIHFFTLIVCSLLFFSSCGVTGSDLDFLNIIYSNSFEGAHDIEYWKGNGSITLVDDTPPRGGQLSALITGDVPYPHSFLRFAIPSNTQLKFEAWAKGKETGGIISLQNITSGDQVELAVTDRGWRIYSSQDYLSAAEGDTIQLALGTNQDTESAMLIDSLNIKSYD
ncbi:MAG: hypothetical protein FH748_12665 [Balneolaceae bacterium]|nr:hypothetical protein [Balneolaceae bacterium]